MKIKSVVFLTGIVISLAATASNLEWKWLWVQTGPMGQITFTGKAEVVSTQGLIKNYQFNSKNLDKFDVKVQNVSKNTALIEFSPPNTGKYLIKIKMHRNIALIDPTKKINVEYMTGLNSFGSDYLFLYQTVK